MSVDALVYIREIPMAEIPTTIGTGPVLPVTITVTALGGTPFSGIAVPSGVDVTLTITAGGGGGGGGGDGGDGASGGGGGATAVVLIPAATWALDGLITLAGGGAGQTDSGLPGDSANDSSLTFDAGEVTVGGGKFGGGTASAPGAGGLVTPTGTGFTVLAARAGQAGSNAVGVVGGAGGLSGGGPGGHGGKGGDNSPVAGADGGAPSVLITFNL